MKDEFTTIDVTRLTPKEKILEMVGQSARPGKICNNSPGFIHEGELEDIATEMDISIGRLKETLLRPVQMYGKTLHKPKHEVNMRRVGDKLIGTEYEMPYGPCVFLDSNSDGHKCRIENAKPLHCKLAKEGAADKFHAWYVLNHAIDAENPTAIRQWAVHLRTHPTIPGGELHDLVPDRKKLADILGNRLQ